MATVVKNFRIKSGLIVEGTTGTINGQNILRETGSDSYILNLVGGATLVKSVEATQLEVNGAGKLSVKSGVFEAAGAAAAAKTAAEATASADATSKANAAASSAISAAATDATSKANAAQAAAISAAATATDTKVSTHTTITTNVHGIADTAALATKSYVDTADALKANLASPTFTGTVAGITKAMVGLGDVDNTTDLLKPVSTATQSALDLKAPLISPSFTTPSLGAATATSIISGNLTLTTALSVANGGTGTSSLTANNILLGDGINALKFVPPGANGNVLTSNGTTWVSAAASTATKPSYQNKFLSTGSYTVPNGVNTLLIEFNGAVGGNGADLEVMNQYSAGCVNPYSVAGGGQSGKANKISALLLVNAGDIISFTLGQNGSKPTTERTPCYPGYTYGTGSYGSYYASNGSAGATSSFSINGNLILSLSSSDVGSGAYNNQGQTQARTPSTSTVNGSSTYNNNFDNYSITILSDAASNETTPYFKIKH